MILDEKSIMALGVLITHHPFKGPARLALQIWEVIEQGNSKHPNDDQTAEEHIEAALRHLRKDGVDEESGLPHQAHVAARCLLGLLALTKEGGR